MNYTAVTLAALLTLLTLSAPTAAKSIYTWVDSDGVTHFGDAPQSEDSKRVKLGTLNTVGNQAVNTAPSHTTQQSKAPDIIMYSASWCGYCKKARAYFRTNHVKFKEYDVETSAPGKRFAQKREKLTVPVFLVNGEEWRGFSEQRFNKLLMSHDG